MGGSLRTGSLPCPVVELPGDVPDRPRPTVGPWHHAPSCQELRARTRALADVVDRFECHTLVADVSMEVAVWGRLAGLRVVAVRQSGQRDDAPHAVGLASADAVWVPQHRALEGPLLDGLDERWHFTGAFSRYDDVVARRRDGEFPPRDHDGTAARALLVVVGAGGTSFPEERWRREDLPPGWRATIVGLPQRWRGTYSTSLGPVADVGAHMARADVVITAGGWASVAEAAACGARTVIVPERRPFDEQLERSRALESAGLAVTLEAWPAPGDTTSLAALAGRLDPSRWDRYYDGRGAQRAAALVDWVHCG